MTLPLLKPKLKATMAIPYGGGYAIDVPEKGLVGTGYTFEALMDNVRKWRKANGFPCGLGLQEEVEAEVCKHWPAECIETDGRVPDRRQRTLPEMLEGLRVMGRHLLTSRELVDDAEAERRAQICLRCPNNIAIAMPCSGVCQALKDAAFALAGVKANAYEGRLKCCAICSCYLSAAIWFPLDTQCPPVTEEQKEMFRLAGETVGCWKQCP